MRLCEINFLVRVSRLRRIARRKAEVCIQSKMKEENFDPVAVRAAHEALLQELEKTSEPQTKAAWERLLGILKK